MRSSQTFKSVEDMKEEAEERGGGPLSLHGMKAQNQCREEATVVACVRLEEEGGG